jgi:hypothetical protein
LPGPDGQPSQDIPGWRLWISATGHHWAIRCDMLTAAQIAAGARPLLWAQDRRAGRADQRGQHSLQGAVTWPRRRAGNRSHGLLRAEEVTGPGAAGGSLTTCHGPGPYDRQAWPG